MAFTQSSFWTSLTGAAAACMLVSPLALANADDNAANLDAAAIAAAAAAAAAADAADAADAAAAAAAVAADAAAAAAAAAGIQQPTPRAQSSAPAQSGDLDLRVFWNKGLKIESEDKTFKFKVGGRLQNDYWTVPHESKGLEEGLATGPALLGQSDGTEFRRARVHMSGTIADTVLFKWAYEFEGGDASFKDAYIGMEDLGPFGKVTVGQQKEPIGLEFAYSSNAATFMERGLPHDLNPERNTGIRFQRTAASDAVYLTGGLYRITNNQGDSGPLNEGWAASARASWAPVYEEKGKRLLHFGLNASYRENLDIYAKGARPSVHGMQPYLASSVTDVDNVTIAGLEAATNFGPLSLQAEYVLNVIERNSGGNATWGGWYAFASYFLTGEHRPYKRSSGAFSAVSPNTSFTKDGGGAWEIAARFSALDLADTANNTTLASGRLQDVTAGVNWYINYNTRIMLNYIHADLQGVGASDAIAMRFQVFF
jgi:phosphate-selective porin OprO/OprP